MGAWGRWVRISAVTACIAGQALAGEQVLASVDLRGPIGPSDPPASARTTIDEPDVAPTANVIARVDLSDQRMYVYVKGELTHVWAVSTGRLPFHTPPGFYKPQWMVEMWRSRKYHMAPMPWSVFFHEGYAVHGTTDLRNLGRPASHGCVRLDPKNAKAFFALVAKHGKDSTIISVVN